jgi:hypothetical protein
MSNLPLFFGRLHPLLVHLPIGILLLAALLAYWPGVQRRTVRFVWVLGTGGAVLAAGCGWLLAAAGNYGGEVTAHRWWGVATVAVGLAGWWFSGRGPVAGRWAGGLASVVLLVTGHLGGQLTHGEDYLWTYAPRPLQQLVGYVPSDTSDYDLTRADPDSVRIFADLIRPVLTERCVQCHNATRHNGGLRLDAAHRVFAGGDGGPILVAGAAVESPWVERVTLPRSHAKAMPPRGEALTYAQVRLLTWWIDRGADTLDLVGTRDIPDDIRVFLRQDYGLETRPRTFAERVRVPAFAEATVLPELAELNWRVTPLGAGRHAVQVAVAANRTVDAAALARLAELLADQVIWLDLRDQPLDAAALAVLPRFRHLNRLRLNGTGVDDATVARLAVLRHLESLNLYGTAITDAALAALAEAPALRQLYLWQTATTDAGVSRLAKANEQLTIDRGFRFAALAKDTTATAE